MIHSGFLSAEPLRLKTEGGFCILRRQRDPGKGRGARHRHCRVML
jgi:hypothetical protein